ncbi:peptidoglycan DD-metalloendopeptidase family protein [Paraburkholderia caballeronis]|uniref:Lipoprotein NlpD n=1 Tax=Paraburkholderia caballeronis TaxID=416943 RepID=A0A1H7QKY4_9BURK|nr:peptidoglycan DD-metalloendopeptidase family protein [Paraburkholderia caballeronis]PXW22487.1 LysM domain-containing protein [Paraburkholderia caballeronis]PXW96358.1 LysM domain-containing protein [Paraburkholderia caballeronis]RAJ92769.1 LysM domain-containing protein [Paraburkholderia caballeronis]TDV34445.1 LysM domain-containing protein [Paraburkholderia caballeronis]SEE03280.1 lipoprotein NlpD [Paraburkholderia caballeronis]
MNRQRRKLGAYAALATVALLASACTLTPWGGSTAPQPVSSTGVPAGYYRVNPGDTLSRIAGAYGQRPQDIAAWNQLPTDAPVVPGQVLRVAPPVAGVPLRLPAPQAAVPGPASGVAGVAAPVPVPSIPLQWPVRGPVVQNFVPGKSTGILIGGVAGQPVKAAAAGRVVYAGTGIEAYGPLIIIKHNDSVVTAYGHNGKLLVNEDEAVVQGQPIAEMGVDSRGVAGVQFEVRADGKPVDPLALLPK